MTYVACPTEIVEAPVDVVWRLLTDLSGWGRFLRRSRYQRRTAGPAVEGQRPLGKAGPRWLRLGVAFEFTRIDALHHQLGFVARLPLGITVHEALDCVPLAGGCCRVNYHCQFDFPGGWRGGLMRLLLSRGLREGPADSLRRLKRAAERRHQGRTECD